MKYYLIVDSDQVNNISRWAFASAVDFSYPRRREVLAIELNTEQELEFLSLFGSYLEPAAGPY